MKKLSLMAAAIVLLLTVFVIAAYLYNTKKADDASAIARQHDSNLVRDYSPTLGSKDAKVIIVEFFDPACETCKSFAPFVKKLMASNPGRIKLVMRYLPLHQGSGEVVSMLEAAHMQNQFWPILNTTFASQSSWAQHHVAKPELLWEILAFTDLDIKKAQQDVKSQVVVQRIQQDISDARQLGVSKTPGFYVNGNPLISFGYRQLQELVATEVRKHYKD